MTSGLIVAAKDDQTHISLSNQFKNKTVEKEYYLFCWGDLINQKGSIENYIIRSSRNRKKMTISKNNTGRFASTDYEVLEEFQINDDDYISFIKCNLNTGRTHQIRVHMSHIGCPLLGDMLYGKQKVEKVDNQTLKYFITNNFISTSRQALHAKKLGFYHPQRKERLTFETPFPSDFQDFLKILRNKE
jgi:23S rRNA pseudouridine1911/1915/1917 synthase